MNRAERRRQLKKAKKAAKSTKSVQSLSLSSDQHALSIRRSIDLAVQHHNAGRLPEAEAIYQQILQADPNQPVALHLLGVINHQVEKNEIAVDLIKKSLAIQPDNAAAHNNLGTALNALGKLDEAVTSYHKALAIKPDNAAAHNNLGNAFKALRKLDEAVTSYQKAVAIKPDYAEAHNNLGTALSALGKVDEAVTSYHKALATKTGLVFAEAHSNLLLFEQYRTDVSLKKLSSIHAVWEKKFGAPLQKEWRNHGNTPEPDRRLRIGFVSPDLKRHPIGYFVVRLFENLPDNAIEIIVYSGCLADDLTDRIRTATNLWRDVREVSDKDLTKIILDDKIDILFDLSGHSAKNRLLVFARKPAPLQVTWAGYVGTTDLSTIDYLLSDIYSTGTDEEKYYVENIIRMPDGWLCYEAPDYAPEVGPSPFKRNGFITFGGFHNPAKVNNLVLSTWAEILKAVPGSRLILKSRNMNAEGNRNRILDPFGAHGVEGTRLTLEGKSPHPELFARYNDVDIALDTFPYSGGLTTCEALWMGVPVITKPGETFAGRHSLSHLMNVGVPELVADDLSDYVSKAVELANDVSRLMGLHSGLRERMANSALCDGEKFATDFTAEMRQIWQEWCLTQDGGGFASL